MTDQHDVQHPEIREITETPITEQRRAFLRGLGKWSQAVIGSVLLGSGLLANQPAQAGGWVNRRGGGGWINGGGGWINGGGSGGWVNRRGGGGWINR